MKFGWILFAMLVMLSGFAFAAETAAEAPAGTEAEHGVSLGTGVQLIVIGVVATVIVFVIIYFLLSTRKRS